MINEESIRAVLSSQLFGGEMRAPLYNSFCFSQLIPSIRAHFLGQPYTFPDGTLCSSGSAHIERVVVIFIDALGWIHIEPRLSSHELLIRFREEGQISVLTSMFPSTTACHVTQFHSGTLPWENLIYEWNCYIPTLNRIICPLIWATPGEQKLTLFNDPRAIPEKILPKSVLYSDLAAHEVTSSCFIYSKYATTPYNTTICDGSSLIGFKKNKDGFQQLIETCKQSPRSYTTFYIDDVDKRAHTFGLFDDHVTSSVDGLLTLLLYEVIHPLRSLDSRTLLVVTSDHGGINVSPEDTIFLDDKDPELLAMIRVDAHQKPLIPCGSRRDLFVHVKPEMLDEFYNRASVILDDKAFILPMAKAVSLGILGPADLITDRYLEALGDFLIIPRGGNQVFWSRGGRFKNKHKASHGGLSAQEMDIPLLSMIV